MRDIHFQNLKENRMKIVTILGILVVFLTVNGHRVSAQSPVTGFEVESFGSQIIPVTLNKMTNIVFPVPIKPGIKVSRNIRAERPKGTSNILVLKAVRRGFQPTNIAIYGEDGSLYSFEIRYAENPEKLNFRIVGTGIVNKTPLQRDADIIANERSFLKVRKREGHLAMSLQGIYAKDETIWFSILLRNRTNIAYTPGSIRWMVIDRKVLKRTAMHKMMITPEFQTPVAPIAAEGSEKIITGLKPFALGKAKILIAEIDPDGGGEKLQLRISQRLLLNSKIVNE